MWLRYVTAEFGVFDRDLIHLVMIAELRRHFSMAYLSFVSVQFKEAFPQVGTDNYEEIIDKLLLSLIFTVRFLSSSLEILSSVHAGY